MATLVDFDTHGASASPTAGYTYGNLVDSDMDCTVESIRVRPVTSGTYTIKVTIYPTSGAALGSGSLTQSFTAGTSYDIALSSPVALTAGVSYWITGYSATAGYLAIATGQALPEDHTGTGVTFTRTNGGRLASADGRPDTTGNFCCTVSPLLTPLALGATLTPATETDSAQPVTRTKRKAIATVTETDGAQALSRQKQRALTPATETDTAVPFPTAIIVALATVTETDEARPITRNTDVLRYRVIFPTYPRTFQSVPIGQTARFVLDQAVSIVRINGTLRQFRNPSQTMLEAAGTEGTDWFIGGRIYDEISYTTHLELQAAGFETEAVA